MNPMVDVPRRRNGFSMWGVVPVVLATLTSSGCSGAASARANARADPPAGAPFALTVVKSLPKGTFYVLAGPNPTSLNLWIVGRGIGERKLTSNKSGFGISSFSASERGVVLADAASGVDELARLTQSGPVEISGGRGSLPDISDAGKVVYVAPPSNTVSDFRVREKASFSSEPYTLLRSSSAVAYPGWSSGSAVYFLSNTHPPFVKGPEPLVKVFEHGRVSTVKQPFRDPSGVLADSASSEIAVASWSNAAAVISAKTVVPLPTGWLPFAWSPTGSELAVSKVNGQLGVWSVGKGSVAIIGSPKNGVIIGGIDWLEKPAKL